jgi:hypothetical protein
MDTWTLGRHDPGPHCELRGEVCVDPYEDVPLIRFGPQQFGEVVFNGSYCGNLDVTPVGGGPTDHANSDVMAARRVVAAVTPSSLSSLMALSASGAGTAFGSGSYPRPTFDTPFASSTARRVSAGH